MKKTTRIGCLFASAALLTLSGTALAQTKDIKGDAKNSGYALSPNGNVVQSGSGLCWRDGYFTASMALAECDASLMPPPPPPPPAPVVQKLSFESDAFFDVGKAELRDRARGLLDKLAADLQGAKLEVIVIVGHTDSTGSAALNDRLSLRRAEAVKAYLVGKGVEANRIYTEGKGSRQPLADNKTAEGRQKNRRVDVDVVATKTVTK